MGREKSLTFLLPITPGAPPLGRGLTEKTGDESALTASVHRYTGINVNNLLIVLYI